MLRCEVIRALKMPACVIWLVKQGKNTFEPSVSSELNIYLFYLNLFRKKKTNRESLFAPVFKNKITQAPNNQLPGAIRFSTFGYDIPPGDTGNCKKSSTLRRQSTNPSNQEKSQTPPTTIEMEDFGHMTELPPMNTCSKHRNIDQSKKNIKLEESRIFVDIRNSAPDVIIMTSH